METAPNKQGNLTNKDFRELIKRQAVKREHPKVIINVEKERKEKKVKTKKYKTWKENDPLIQLLSKYRDRAKERREGMNPDYLNISDPLIDRDAYHAVGPDIEYNIKLAERRKQLIQESKYLGGDMAHTHLVKGLDFALLNKVRSEIEAKTKEVAVEENVEEDTTGFKSKMAKNIHDILFNSEFVVKNSLFAPGKMCYTLDPIETETDVPTTVIRSQTLDMDEGKTMMRVTTDAIIDKIRRVMQIVKEGNVYRTLKKVEPLPEIYEEKKEEKKIEPQKYQQSKTDAIMKKLFSEPTAYEEYYPGHELADDSDYDDPQPEEEPRASNHFGPRKMRIRKNCRSEKQCKNNLDRDWVKIKNRFQI